LDPVRPDRPVPVGRRVLKVGQERYPAFERGQLAQLDPPKPMIAKRAQERILLESCAQRLRIERPNAPSQPRAPPTRTISTDATTSRNTRIPRDEQRVFVIGEERLDGRCVRQRAVKRIKGVKAMFGTARRTICLDRVYGAARERRCPIYIFIFMHRHLGIGNTCICRRCRCRFCSGTSVSNHPWR